MTPETLDKQYNVTVLGTQGRISKIISNTENSNSGFSIIFGKVRGKNGLCRKIISTTSQHLKIDLLDT